MENKSLLAAVIFLKEYAFAFDQFHVFASFNNSYIPTVNDFFYLFPAQ